MIRSNESTNILSGLLAAAPQVVSTDNVFLATLEPFLCMQPTQAILRTIGITVPQRANLDSFNKALCSSLVIPLVESHQLSWLVRYQQRGEKA